jgi:hypothetical protein
VGAALLQILLASASIGSLRPTNWSETVGEVSQDGNSTLADELGATLRPCGSHAHGCHMHGGDRGFFVSPVDAEAKSARGSEGSELAVLVITDLHFPF